MSNKENDSSKILEKSNESDEKTDKKTLSENEFETNSNNIQLIEENDNFSDDPYIKYITQIEQLQNELNLEKSITNSIKNFGATGEEIIKLKSDLEDKEQKLLQLKLTNKKQEEVLNSLRNKMNREIPKHNKSNSQNYKKQNMNNEIIQNEAINIVLKIKDRELNDAIQKMNTLKKENQNLKNELYKNDDYTKKLEIEDTSKENNEKIKELNTELKLLNKQLMAHKICLDEQDKINKEYNELKNKLKELKNNANENKNKIKDIEQPRLSTEPNEQNLLSSRIYNSKKRKNVCPNSEKKINNLSTIVTSRNNNIILPPINTPRKLSQNKNNLNNSIDQTILTNDFIERVKNYFENNKEEVETLLVKINEIENCRTTIENKHKSEISQFNKQINTLDEQFQLLNNNGKSNNSNIKILKNKLNIIKGEAKHQSKMFTELKKEFDSLENTSKEKDYEISLLLGQINSLRNLVNFTDTIIPEDKIDSYVNKLKNEQNNKKPKSPEKEKNNISNNISNTIPNNISNNKKSIKKEMNKNEIYSYEDKTNNKNNKNNKNYSIGKKKGYDFIDDTNESGKKLKNS